MSGGAPILWRRLDRPGHESARLVARAGGGWALEGGAAFGDGGLACRLDYAVECDGAWRTRRARVDGWLGAEPVALELAADGEGRWTLDGARRPEVDGALDVDLGFSPSTNVLPIRRLGLAVGSAAPARAAWP